MKAYITKKGVEIFAENMSEAYALRHLLPPGEDCKKLTIHSDPETLREYEKEPGK